MTSEPVFYSKIGAFLCYHSTYMDHMIYRQYNMLKDRAMMSYFAILWKQPANVTKDSEAYVILHACNLSGIKAAVKAAARGDDA